MAEPARDDHPCDRLIHIPDGDAQLPILVHMTDWGVKRLQPDPSGSLSVVEACELANGLLKNGIDFSALLVCAKDSPRVGPVLLDIADALRAMTFDVNPQPGGVPASNESERP